MTLTRWAAAPILVGLLLAGCQRKPVSDAAPPSEVSPEVRERIQRLAPDAIVGRVIAVLPDERLASVADVPTREFQHGDVVTFMAATEVEIGSGTVVRVQEDTIHVRYPQPGQGQRAPAIGDLAIRFERNR